MAVLWKRKNKQGSRPLRSLRFRIFFRIILYWKRSSFQDHPRIGKGYGKRLCPAKQQVLFADRLTHYPK
jgi:hypothetical protein